METPFSRRDLLPPPPPPPPPSFFQFSPSSTPLQLSQFKGIFESTSLSPIQPQICKKPRISRWKSMCLYYTQDKCTMMDDPRHLEKFNHSCSLKLGESVRGSHNVRVQEFDYFLVLDLEGQVEILEFPVLLFDAKTMEVVDVFHRFVRPTKMSQEYTNKYIEGKYGAFGVDRVWHDTAIYFNEVIEQFESWLKKERDGHNNLWGENGDGRLNKAAFVTCGNWDVKTKIPEQCQVCGMNLPPYFMEWINIKDIYLNLYKNEETAKGMMSMMIGLGMQALGSHHLGIDDSRNIARVLQRMLIDGALMQITAKRSGHIVTHLFENRVSRFPRSQNRNSFPRSQNWNSFPRYQNRNSFPSYRENRKFGRIV